MRGRIRLVLLAIAAVLAAGAAMVANTAQAATSDPPATVLDGMALGHLPGGLGTSSDFDYTFQRVHFAARVWESRAPAGGWRVDLDLDVMRGDRLTDGRALHDWFIAYEDRQPQAHYVYTRVHGHPAWLGRDQVFWLQRAGLAVSVQVDGTRWSTLEVARTGWAVYELPS